MLHLQPMDNSVPIRIYGALQCFTDCGPCSRACTRIAQSVTLDTRCGQGGTCDTDSPASELRQTVPVCTAVRTVATELI